MKARRNTLDIANDVLLAISQESKPTRIMYRANLSWQPVTKHINRLVGLGWVEAREMPADNKDRRSTKEYFLTPLGQEKFKVIKETVKALDGLFER